MLNYTVYIDSFQHLYIHNQYSMNRTKNHKVVNKVRFVVKNA